MTKQEATRIAKQHLADRLLWQRLITTSVAERGGTSEEDAKLRNR